MNAATPDEVYDGLRKAEDAIMFKRFDEGIEAYEKLMEGGAEAIGDMLHNLVPLYIKAGKPARALAAAQALTYFQPQLARSWMILCAAQEKMGFQEAALISTYRALEIDPHDESAQETRLYYLASKLSPTEYRAAAEEWYGSRPTPPQYPSRPVSSSDGRLRIGYLSGDFRVHVMGRIIFPLLMYHNRSLFDVWCLDNSPGQDRDSEAMRAYEGITWRYIHGLRDEAVAEMIHNEKIDVLVDLCGLAFKNRLEVFMRRPAPIQVTGIGYLPTTGAGCFDWRLADCEDQAQYSEQLWRLPAQTAPLPLAPRLPITPLPYQRNGYITFGFVNGFRKMTQEVIRVFVSVLKAVPNSKLLLMVPGAADDETAKSILRRFDPVQGQILLTDSPGGIAFCRLFSEIDIALDPFPYGGGVTSSECLYHGVPVICYPGDRRIAYETARLQINLGLRDFVTNDYARTAKWMAENPLYLAETRATLREKLLADPSGQPEAWVRSLEASYVLMANAMKMQEAA